MVVQVEVGRGYLGQCLMLMLICEGQTDNGRRRQVIVESHSQLDVALYSKIDIQMAGFEGTSEDFTMPLGAGSPGASSKPYEAASPLVGLTRGFKTEFVPKETCFSILENHSDGYIKGSPTITFESERLISITEATNLSVRVRKSRMKLVFYATNVPEHIRRGFDIYSPIPSIITYVPRCICG